MNQFRENLRADGRMDGKTEGRRERPNFIAPFRLRPGIQKACYPSKAHFETKGWSLLRASALSFLSLTSAKSFALVFICWVNN